MYAIYMEGRKEGGGVFSGENDKICHLPGLEKKPGLKINKNSPVGFIAFLGGFYWS